MANADPALLRLVDAVANLTNNSRERAERDERADERIIEKLDELLRLQHEERAILAELRHQVGDDVTGAFASALSQHATEERLASEQAATAQRHALAGIVQSSANREATARLAARSTEQLASGGEATGKHAVVDEPIADVRGVRVPWKWIGAALAFIGATAGGYLLRHLVPPH